MANQAIANKALSLAVNCGVRPAAKMLQEVLGVSGDGRIGPITLDRLDQADAERVLTELKARAETYYERLAAENPALQKFLKGWLRRAAA